MLFLIVGKKWISSFNILLSLCVKSLGLKKKPAYNIIYPAVNRKIFKNDSLVKIITKNRIEILTVAGLHWVKGLDYTIQALSKLKNVDFNYTIVGSGPDYERIILAIKQCNRLKNVKIVDHLPRRTYHLIIKVLICTYSIVLKKDFVMQ